MQNDSQAMATLSGANTVVEMAGWTVIAGAGAVLAPGAYAFVTDYWLQITAITAATTFTIAETAGVAGLEATPAPNGHIENDPNGGEPREDVPPISGPPVAGETPPPPAF